MSFTPLKFVYDPPLTVETGVPAVATSSSSGSTSASLSAADLVAASNATLLTTRLVNLQATNAYLQQLILDYTSNIVIQIDPNTDVEMAAAANQVYGSVPSGITTAMYSNLLDAEVTSQVLSSTLQGTGDQLNPVQQSSIMGLTSAVDNALLNNVTFASQLPILLRSLKTDQATFQGLALNLQAYPIQSLTNTTADSSSIIQASTIDVSSSLNTYLNSALDDFTNNYGAVYNLVGTAATINTDLGTLQAMQSQTVSEVTMIVSLISSAQGLVYKDVFLDLAKDLGNFVYARLILEASVVVIAGDKFTQMALGPLKSLGGELNGIISKVSALTNAIGTAPAGSALGGISKANSCCGTNSNIKGSSIFQSASQSSGASTLTKGVKEAVSHLLWLQNQVASKLNNTLSQFKKVLGRRLASQTSQANLLCSLKSAEALIGIAGSIVNQATGSNTVTIPTSVTSTLNAVASAPPVVQTVLASGGVTIPTTTTTVTPGTIATQSNIISTTQAGGLSNI